MLALAKKCIKLVLSLPPSIKIDNQLGQVPTMPLTRDQRIATAFSLVTFTTLAACHNPTLLAVYGNQPSAIPEESKPISAATPNDSKAIVPQ